MKVLYVIEGISQKGGLERILIDKMNAIASGQAVEVALLTVWQGDGEPVYALDNRIERHSLHIAKPASKLAWLLSLAKVLSAYNRAIKTIKPDVVVHFRAMGAFLIGFGSHACRATHCKIVFESHLFRPTNNHLWLYPGMERKADIIVCLTNGDKEEYLREGRCHDVRVIANFTDIEPIGVPDYSHRHCIFVGRCCAEKDPERLLSLWKSICRRHPDWTLDVYGDGWSDKQGENVCFHGIADDVAAIMQKGSMLLLTSKTEGFGLCLLEAMKCGLPVVSLDTHCGPSDLIDNGVTGYCTPYDSDDAFVEAVERLIGDEVLRKQMGHAAQLRAKRFDKETIIKKWMELFMRKVE